MSEKRPNVFPQKDTEKESEYLNQVKNEASSVFNASNDELNWSSVDEMSKRTQEQIKMRDEQLKMNIENTKNYSKQLDSLESKERVVSYKSESIEPVINKDYATHNMSIGSISQPQFDTPFDLLPLPSEGKLYKNKKSSIKMSFLTAADENILTSPNLMQSGEFLDILINRKILEPDLRYDDLVMGDRDAIMVWLRATSYGEMYPAIVYDENDEPFETIINLNELKINKLNVEPDSDGLFQFKLPISGKIIRFKLLTMADIKTIDKWLSEDKKNNVLVNKLLTYTLLKNIVEIDGNINRRDIDEQIQNFRAGDAKALRDYITSIDCGIDRNIEVKTPRGGSIKTFLPITPRFFWPDSEI